MKKATVRIPYSPTAIDFWNSHWALRAPMQALEAREKLVTGDNIRVILMKEDNQDVAILQGPELDVVMFALEGSEDPVAQEIVRRLRPVVDG